MTDQLITYDLNDIHNIINNYENNIQDEETSCYKVKKIPHNNIHYNKYLIKYKKDKLTNENINRVGLFRSVVVYKDNKTDKLSIKVFSPPKSSAYNLFISNESNKFNECYRSKISFKKTS